MPIGPGAIRLCRSCSSHTIDTYLVESGDLLGRNNAVCANIGEQIAAGDDRIIGVMVESHLVGGRQDLVPGRELTYGQSITDGCIDWDSSLQVLENLAASVRQRRLTKSE